MSADNAIFIQEYNRRYHVWHGFASCWPEKYDKTDRNYKKFETREKALIYAHDLVKEIRMVEYGVVELTREGE